MTLILGASKPEGIYMCVDYRVSDARTRRIMDDAASKCLTIHYPPLGAGTKALIGFTGVAVLPDGTPTLTWIRQTLRGESDLPDASFALLHERLNRDFGRLRQPLIINVLALHEPDGRRFFGGFSNLRSTAMGTPMTTFGYVMDEVDNSFIFSNGSGAIVASADAKMAKAQSLLGVVPRKSEDFMKLLSIVNRRVAARVDSVSPFCHVHFIPSSDKHSPTSRAFTENGEDAPFDMPFLLAGIDMTDIVKGMMDAVKAGNSPPNLDPSVINEQIKRRR